MAGIILNGSVIKGLMLNGSSVSAMLNGVNVFPTEEPSGPLPAYTLRLRFADGVTPTNSKGTLTQVSSSPNIWDWTYSADWTEVWYNCNTLLEVIDGNTSNVTNMLAVFACCSSLTSVSLLDTSNVTCMSQMFYGCTSLTAVPLFDTSKVTTMSYMFQNCYKVESGALALYQQASSQTTPPLNHSNTFRNCGRDTTTGAAELAQIPSDWK